MQWVARKILLKRLAEIGGDYVISLKKNQKSLYQRVEELFKQAITNKYKGFTFSTIRVSEPTHGRNETRHCVVLSNVKGLIDPEGEWDSLYSVGMIDFMRTYKGKTRIRDSLFY